MMSAIPMIVCSADSGSALDSTALAQRLAELAAANAAGLLEYVHFYRVSILVILTVCTATTSTDYYDRTYLSACPARTPYHKRSLSFVYEPNLQPESSRVRPSPQFPSPPCLFLVTHETP